MKAAWYILIILFTTLWGCKKDCDETYTISGRMLNGTSGEPYADTSFGIRVVEEKNFGGINRETLGRSETDSDGYFSINYKCTDIGDVILLTMGNWETSLPKNQDIIDKIIYFSDSATVVVNFKTSNPLQSSSDSLYWEYAHIGSDIVTDTIVGPQPSSFTRTLRVRPSTLQFLFGRTYKEFSSKKSVDIKAQLAGDPYINEVTIEY